VRFTLEQVEAFVLAARCGSFSGAARMMGRSQSTVSTSIANLEIALDTELFDRTSRFPAVTPEGEKLLQEAKALYDRGLAFERHGDSLSQGEPTEITLAVGIPHRQLSPVLTKFAEEFPYVDLTIQNPANGDVRSSVQNDEALLGIAFALPDYPEDLAFRQLGRLFMTHVVERDHPLATVVSPGFEDLRGYRHLAYASYSRALPTSEYLQSTQTWHSDSYQALIELVKSGVGWATIPRQLILEEIVAGELVELQMGAYPFTDWEVNVDLIWRRGRRFPRVEEWLRLQLCRHRIHEIGRDGQDTTRL
jgi:DNA-binding transcriptional LysR family regulator